MTTERRTETSDNKPAPTAAGSTSSRSTSGSGSGRSGSGSSVEAGDSAGVSRAQFLRGTAAVGLMAVSSAGAGAGRATAAPATAAPGTAGPGAVEASAGKPWETVAANRLQYKGVAYDTGTGFLGDDSRALWRPALVRGELRVIREDLHANWVTVYGSDVGRLTSTSAEALSRGMAVSIQPRAFDEPQEAELEKLRRTSIAAERLRRRYAPEVMLVIGCEFMLFTPGLIPGANFFERVEHLTKGDFDLAAAQRRFRTFTAQMAAVARRHFNGRVTYAAAADLENVDWSLFDVVGLDYYSYHEDPAGHTAELAPFRRWGKPIAILEFGCCAFTGAAPLGGMGWDIVDHSFTPPRIKPGYVRNETEQAEHVAAMLGVFESEGVLGASVHTFISPDAPHRPKDPLIDEDMAAYGLVKVLRKRSLDPRSPYRWEPKEAFHAVAGFYGTR